MDIKVTHNFKLKDAFTKGDKSQLFDRVGQFLIAQITSRVGRHVDADGKSFQPYSPAYAAQRKASGRSAAVNLAWTGRMMGSVQNSLTKIDENTVEVGVTGDEVDKAAYVEDGGRQFIGVNDKDSKIIDGIVDAWCDEQIEKL